MCADFQLYAAPSITKLHCSCLGSSSHRQVLHKNQLETRLPRGKPCQKMWQKMVSARHWFFSAQKNASLCPTRLYETRTERTKQMLRWYCGTGVRSTHINRSVFDTHISTRYISFTFAACLLVYTWIGRGKKCVCPRYASTCLPHISYTTWQQTTRTLASAGHWLLSFWAFMGFPSFNDSTYKYQKKVFIFHLNIQNRSRISIINEKKQNYIAETFSSNREETPGRRLEDPTPPTASSGI